MPSPDQARRALVLLTTAAVDTARRSLADPQNARDALLDTAPLIVGTYSDGTAALAADNYDDLRERAEARGLYVAEPVVNLREDKIRTGVLWATGPLYTDQPDPNLAAERLAEVIQFETARPYRDTITTNAHRDPAAAGWYRVTSGSGCKFCAMLAGRGAVYKETTARFASHPHCHCTAAPEFGNAPEANVVQYTASARRRSPADRQRVRDFLASMPD